MAWLLAALAPRAHFERAGSSDVAPTGPEKLAALISGEGVWARATPVTNPNDAIALEAVALAFNAETIADGVTRLFALVEDKTEDLAKRVALALVCAASAVELEEHSRVVEMLEALIGDVQRHADEDARLLQVAVLTQLGLRRMDVGLIDRRPDLEALAILAELNTQKLTAVPRRSGEISGMQDVVAALVSAAQSQQAWNSEAGGLPKPTRAARLTELTGARVDAFADLLNRLYRERTGSRVRHFGGQGRVDLFHVLLGWELLGHVAVYVVRKQLAQIRVVQAQTNADPNFNDVLRLLRHAGAKSDLDLALDWLRSQGPLNVLSTDARLVISKRLIRPGLRATELKVLTTASELLTQSEATVALGGVALLLADGPPGDLPGQWEADASRLEAGWVAAVALGNVAGQADSVCTLLYSQAAGLAASDALADIGLARALSALEWDQVTEASKRRWTPWTQLSMREGQRTIEVLRSHGLAGAGANESDLDRIIARLNVALRDDGIAWVAEPHDVQLLRDLLLALLRSSQSGTHSGGGVRVTDVAAGLIAYGQASDLWDDLTAVLTDPSVLRDDKSAAFERLASAGLEAPAESAARLRGSAAILLAASDGFWGKEVTPYPEALRFLAASRLLDSNQVFALVSELTASPQAKVRREAAITLELLAKTHRFDWAHEAALRLSYDQDAFVRGRCGRALCRLMLSQANSAEAAQIRVAQLLAQDGLIVPLLTLYGLDEVSNEVPEPLLDITRRLSLEHPSRRIRVEANSVLSPS